MASVLERTQRIARGYWLPIALVLVSLAAIAGTITGRLANRGSQSTSKASILYVAPEKLNFGEAWETDHFEWTLPVENRGPSRVNISQASTSCSCTSVSPSEFTIEPGQSRELALVIDLRSKSGDKTERSSFEVMVSFKVKSESPGDWNEHFEKFQISGQVKKAFIAAPVIYLGRISEFASIPPLEIPVELMQPLARIEAQTDASGFSREVIIPAAGERKITLKLGSPPKLPLGPFQGTSH